MLVRYPGRLQQSRERPQPVRHEIELRMEISWVFLWRDQHADGKAPVLNMRRDGQTIVIDDTRSCRTAKRHRLKGLAARVYAECDEAIDRRALVEGLAVGEAEINKVTTSLIDANLLLDFNGRILTLAVDTSRPRPEAVPTPGGSVDWESIATT